MALLKEEALRRLRSAWENERFAHAYLLEGVQGSGKAWLVDQLAALVLNTSPEEVASHPDFHSVGPESKSRRILIQQMRGMENAIQMKPLLGRTKVAVIRDADRLQPQAANSFLKTLEEPPPGSHIFLLTSVPDAVLETILSRCISVPLRPAAPPPPTERELLVAETLRKALVGEADLASAIRFTRVFQSAISETRESITDELEAAFKKEVKAYKDTTDSRWQDGREEQIKARAEAVVVQERARLLAAAERVLVDALRHHHEPSDDTSVAAIAARNPPHTLLQRLAALNHTRDLLARGVNEGLALESGFLEMIALP